MEDYREAFGKAAALISYERERFTAQAEFARQLAARTPEKARDWDALLGRAGETVARAAATGDAEGVRAAVREAESVLAPIGRAAKKHVIHCVGHAHIDMNWQWSWPETVSVTVDTITTVLRLMDEFPGFVFSQSQASVYRILEEHRPDLLSAVKKAVAAGRWEVTASHWVETDKNMVSGEGLCRHLLYTRAYMRDLFGLKPEDVPIDWSPDTFGHAHSVPTYLERGGVKYVYLHRPGGHGEPQPRPQAFLWQAPDGARVLVRNDMRLGYNGVVGPRMVSASLLPMMEERGLPFTMFVYGVGDHGGGPTRRDVARVLDMAQWPVFPDIRFSTARAFFQRLEKEAERLPVIDGELNAEFTGCYTTQTLIKKANRHGERRLLEAETASLFAGRVAGGSHRYAPAAFLPYWRDHLFSHFHDILPGSGVRDTRTYTHGLYQGIAAFASSVRTQALRALAARVDTGAAANAPGAAANAPGAAGLPVDLPSSLQPWGQGAGAGNGTAEGAQSRYNPGLGAGRHPFVVFNMIQSDANEVVEAMIWDPGWGWEEAKADSIRFLVEGPDGESVTAQVLERGNYWGHRFQRIAFPSAVKGFGYARYLVSEEAGPEAASSAPEAATDSPGANGTRLTGPAVICRYTSYERSPEGMENGFLRLDIDTRTGGIRRLLDKTCGAVLEGRGAPLLEFLLERPRSMSAWQVEHAGPTEAPEVVKMERLSNGPWKAEIAVHLRVRRSSLRLVYELRAGDPRLHLGVTCTWFERGDDETGTPALRLSLPMGVESPRTSYEIPFGSVERRMAHGEEVPALRWARVSGMQAGKAVSWVLVNDSKHGHSFQEGTLRLTLIRSSSDPDPLPEIGEHEVHGALQCMAAESGDGEAMLAAAAFDHPPVVVATDAHAGDLPASGAFLTVRGGGIVSALKQAEDGDGLVLRAFNPDPRPSELLLEAAERMGRVKAVQEIDVLERPEAESMVCLEKGVVKMSIEPRSLGTARVRWEKP
jgi:alpha-mannosidase